jgi:hypothetical protein
MITTSGTPNSHIINPGSIRLLPFHFDSITDGSALILILCLIMRESGNDLVESAFKPRLLIDLLQFRQ